MINLVDYFSPLTPLLIGVFIILFVIFDSLGFYLNHHLIKAPPSERNVFWLIGLGFFVFTWFVMGFFIPPQRLPVLASLAFFSLTVPFYTRNKAYRYLWSLIKELKLFIILLIPLLPAVWVKASLPPYQWDELVYHYNSPWGLAHLQTWQFKGDFYGNLPRVIDTFNNLIFSLTNTFAVSRAFHFLTYLTVLGTSFLWLKRRFSSPLALILPAIFLFYPPDIIATATSGYVDIAAFSFMFLAMIFTLNSLTLPSYLNLSLVFWAMAIGTKYNSLQPLVAFGLAAVILNFRKLFSRINYRYVLIGGLIFLIFGGYWYLKNLILTGNPTFPLFFPCYRFKDACQQGGSYFSWTTPLTLTNIPTIAYFTFFGSKILALFTLVSFGLAFFVHPKSRQPLLFFGLGLTINFLLVKFSSGYYQRYFTYLSMIFFFLLTFISMSPLAPRWTKLKPLKILFTAALIIVVIHNFPRAVRRTYSPQQLSPFQVNYALGKSNTNAWIRDLFPDIYPAIEWCNSRSDPKENFYVYDPDLIWYDFQGRFTYYLANCTQVNQEVINTPLEKIVPNLIKEKKNFYIASLTNCRDTVVKMYPFETDVAYILRQQSNEIICHSTPITNNLYFFDWQFAAKTYAQ